MQAAQLSHSGGHVMTCGVGVDRVGCWAACQGAATQSRWCVLCVGWEMGLRGLVASGVMCCITLICRVVELLVQLVKAVRLVSEALRHTGMI